MVNLLGMTAAGLSGKIKRRNSRLFIFLFAVVCIACVSYPVVSGMVVSNGTELDYNLLRIESLKNGLLSGVFPTRINAEFFSGYGYGASLTVPDLFLYIPALLRITGCDINFSYNIFLLFCICLTFVTVYICGKYISKSRYVGLISAALVVLSQYYTNVLYYRANMGEILSFIFMPLVIMGMYSLICDSFDKPYILFIGFTGLFFSHISLFMITTVISLFLCLIFSRRFTKNPGRLLRLFYVIILTALVTMCFWLPYIEQLSTTTFWSSWLNMDRITASLGSLFSVSQNYVEGEYVIPAFGVVLLLLCFLRVFIRQNKQNSLKLEISDRLLVIGLFCIWAASRYFPLNIWWMIKGIGFPTSLQLPAVVLLAVCAALILDVNFTKHKQRSMIMFAVTVVSVLVLWTGVSDSPLSYTERQDDYFSDSYYTYPMTETAMIPDGAEYSKFNHSGQIEFDDGTMIPVSEKNNTHIRFEQSGYQTTDDNIEYHLFANVPLLYYHGYAAEFTDQHGNVTPLEVSWENEAHTIRVQLPPQEGIVHVWYAGTMIQTVSFIVSIIASGCAVVFFIFVGKRKKQEQV